MLAGYKRACPPPPPLLPSPHTCPHHLSPPNPAPFPSPSFPHPLAPTRLTPPPPPPPPHSSRNLEGADPQAGTHADTYEYADFVAVIRLLVRSGKLVDAREA